MTEETWNKAHWDKAHWVKAHEVKIPFGRQPPTQDSLLRLMTSIQDQGLKFPILVDDSSNLIDGLRRLTAMVFLGHTKIPVVVISDHGDGCDLLEAARLHGDLALPLTLERIRQIALSMRQVSYKTRAITLNLQLGRGKRHEQSSRKGKNHPSHRTRGRLAQALGLGSGHYLAALSYLFTPIEKGEPDVAQAKMLLDKVKSGELTIWVAAGALREARKGGEQPATMTLAEQRLLIANAAASFGGLVSALKGINKFDPQLSKEELASAYQQFYASRSMLSTFMNMMKEEISKR